MTVPFGALTDHFSLAATDLILVGSSKTPIAKSRADAQDEEGNVAASTWYGAPDTMFEVSCTYALKSGTLNLNTLKCGFISAGICVLSIDVKTENGAWPQITVSGRLGCVDPDPLRTYTLPSVTISGKKQAQAMGFTVTAGCKLTGSGLTASVDFAEQANGLGVPVAQGVSGGTLSGSGDFVGITATPAWTVTGVTGAVETQAPGTEEPQAAYATGTGTWECMLAVDALA